MFTQKRGHQGHLILGGEVGPHVLYFLGGGGGGGGGGGVGFFTSGGGGGGGGGRGEFIGLAGSFPCTPLGLIPGSVPL